MTYYLTTAIAYTNGDPHIGHLYEYIIADVISRYQKILGKDVRFLTGTDEHGQKIREFAKIKKLDPKEYCDIISDKFKDLNKDICIDYDRFIRTTDIDHIDHVHKLYHKCKENNDIYLGNYEGWYSVREESLITEVIAKRNNYKDPITGKDLIKISEPSYFFRLSKYKDQIIEYLNKDIIYPKTKKNNILNIVNNLNDISISRTTIKWGISLPDDEDHVFYVWFDALTNYITGSNGYWTTGIDIVHVIGKDILFFHSVIWIGMLLSAGYELPKKIFVHDFVCDSDGKKMSKSVGNVIDPNVLIKKYPIDAIRYYCIRYGEYDNDFNFSEDALKMAHDHELLEKFGNLSNRVIKMIHKNNILNYTESIELFDIDDVINNICKCLDEFRLSAITKIIVNILNITNKYFHDMEPWKLKDNDQSIVLKTSLESLIIIIHLLHPIAPVSTGHLLKHLDCHTFIDKLRWNNISYKLDRLEKIDKLFDWLDKDAYQKRLQKNINK